MDRLQIENQSARAHTFLTYARVGTALAKAAMYLGIGAAAFTLAVRIAG